jgi:very-short-patch-repair endonuclease
MDSLVMARTLGFDAMLQVQDGLIRRDQALAVGHSRARIDGALRAGRWQLVLPRVYAVGGGPLRPAQRLRAVWLWAGDDSSIAGSAAAWWQRLHTAFPPVIAVLVPPGRRMSDQPLVRVIRAHLDQRDWTWRDGVRVTAAHRTCLDLVRSGRHDLLDDALRRRHIQLDELPGSLARSRHRRGQVRARRAVREVAASPWSKPERRVHELLRQAGISGWVANHRARPVDGSVHPDVEFESVKLAVEIDGREYHDPELAAQAFEDDHERELALVAAGWPVLRFTVRQIMEQPERFLQLVRDTLARLVAAQRV